MNIEAEAINWRFKKLNEVPEHPEEPNGIGETIDAFVWGKQSAEQKAISNRKVKVLGRANKIWIKKEKKN